MYIKERENPCEFKTNMRINSEEIRQEINILISLTLSKYAYVLNIKYKILCKRIWVLGIYCGYVHC